MLETQPTRIASIPVDAALRAAAPAVARILGTALEGSELQFTEALELCCVQGDDLVALVAAADEMRRRAVGDAITYVVNRNINFTNVCTVGCSFCGFSRGPRADDAYFLSLEEIAAKACGAWKSGATEVCIQGGLPRDLDGWFYRDILRAIKRAVPEMHIHAFSPMEIANGVDRTGLPLREYLLMLKSEGLGSIPGTAAEILDDSVRAQLSPNKLPVARWVEIIRAAHAIGIPTTSTMMYGHVETAEHRIRHMLLLREIQRDTGGFTEFVPLGFVHPNTRLYRDGEAQPGASRPEHLIVHAIARLLLGPAIPNLQVSWVKMGLDLSLACLEAGANDFSGTLMEESISKSAGATFGEYVAPEEFRARIRSIGRIPAERTTTYRIRQTFSREDSADRIPPPAAPRGRASGASGRNGLLTRRTNETMKITALAGGVGASKLLLGLSRAMDPRDLTIIVNTGDDIVLHGLYICPDLDIVTYTLAGSVNPETGWGLAGDTFHSLKALARYAGEQWFHLGDRDLATHIHRTDMLWRGQSLAQITDAIRRDWGVASRILPMCDHPVPTTMLTSLGDLHFQEYLVQHGAEPEIFDIRFEGVESARPAPGVLEALREADGILICPSNPLISVGPIVAVPGVRETLWERRDRCIAISPLVGGKSLKGPSDKMLTECLIDASSCGVALLYEDIASVLVIDPADSPLCPDIIERGMRPVLIPSVMRTDADKERLAQGVLSLFSELSTARA